LIAQALINNSLRQVLNVTYLDKEDVNIERQKRESISDITKNKLELKHSFNEHSAKQFFLHVEGAKDFLNTTISADFLSQYIKEDIEAPFKES
jgi:hypothetical protein